MTAMSATAIDSEPIVREAEGVAAKLNEARSVIGEVIFGQETVVEQTLITILSGGHGLLVGVPGVGKTKLADTMGAVFGLDAKRIQFTPDLLPSDILGSEVLDETADHKKNFRLIKGPVFAQLLLADEINRASPRTQSALLQAMQEYHVTVAGVRHDLDRPFHVLATQNPIELEGTYPLPEAQLDRFLMQIDVPYPALEPERLMILKTTGATETNPRLVMTAAELTDAQRLVRRMPVGEGIVETILKLVRALRPREVQDPNVAEHIAWGAGPRASQALMLMVRARALLDGRYAPSLDDVEALAIPTLQHRMAVTLAARAADGITVRDLISTTLKAVL